MFGIILSAIFFASKISKVKVAKVIGTVPNKTIYQFSGQLFFASVTDFVNSFDFRENEAEVDIDFSNAHLWDDSVVGVVDRVVMKFHQSGITVNLKGLIQRAATFLTSWRFIAVLKALKESLIFNAKNTLFTQRVSL
ncbi:STAS domain-containing protein [Fictibacillus sp. NRS-1165]|uniref:STAS domain-containing protein n=1 Tax=Fictibacillus sp. NRS-1165 TaxID=3144463 RepID=UPI003D21BD9C